MNCVADVLNGSVDDLAATDQLQAKDFFDLIANAGRVASILQLLSILVSICMTGFYHQVFVFFQDYNENGVGWRCGCNISA